MSFGINCKIFPLWFFSGYKIQEHLISDVIRRVFIDLPPPSDLKYNFDKNPPKITGQIGIPPIVDQLLGNVSLSSDWLPNIL